MCDLPVDIFNEEKLVRTVRECHLNNKGKLQTNVFRSAPGTDEVSVMRHTHLGTETCRAKSTLLASEGSPYRGMASIGVDSVRRAGSEVKDTREENFCGHADILHGIVVQKDEPPESELSLKLLERLRELKKAAKYFHDPQPASDHWTGETI